MKGRHRKPTTSAVTVGKMALTGAVLGSGGWVLSRSASDTRLIDMVFEFERQSCLEIYSILIASGVVSIRQSPFPPLFGCMNKAGSLPSIRVMLSLDLRRYYEPLRLPSRAVALSSLYAAVGGLPTPVCQCRFKIDTVLATNADLKLIHPHYVCIRLMRWERSPVYSLLPFPPRTGA